MNRFDNTTVSAYTPQSFQELAFVPMMKRQQHDEMSKNLAELNAIATDPLNEHRDEAVKLKQDLENKLGNLSGELASRGIDGIGKEAFYKLQKERNDLIAPTGRIGQINAVKIDYNKQKEDFIKNAEQQKIGRDRALQLWNEKTKDYSGYDDKRNILNITPQGVAAHQDYEDDLMKYHSILGKTTTSAKSSGYSIVDSGQGDGSKVMIDKTGNIVHSDNITQLNNAIKGFSSKWINPNGEGAKYAKDAGLNITSDKVFSDFKAMTEKSDIDNRGQQTQYIPGKSSGDGENGEATPLISIQNEIQSKEFANQKYSDNLKEYKRLSSIPVNKRTEEDNVKLELIKNLQKDVDEKLKQTNVYKQNQPKVQAFDSKIDPLYRSFIQNADNMSANEYDKEIENIIKKELAKIKTTKGFVSGREGIVSINVRKKANDLLNQRRDIYKPITEAKNKLTALNNRQFYHYALAPITEKEQGQYQNLNNNLATAVKSSPSALSNLGLIESVDLANGSKKYKLTEEQRNQIQTLLYNSDRKNIRLESVSEKGPGGKPQLRIAFTPNEDDDIDLTGVNWFGKNSDNLNNKEIYFNLAVNNLTNKKAGGPDIKNIVGLIVNYIGERGETTENGTTEGYDIAKSFINNAYGVND